jgi:hypothetical protein
MAKDTDNIVAQIARVLIQTNLLAKDEAFDLSARWVCLGRRMAARSIPPGEAARLALDLVMMGFGCEQVVTGRACPVDGPVLPYEWMAHAREVALNQVAASGVGGCAPGAVVPGAAPASLRREAPARAWERTEASQVRTAGWGATRRRSGAKLTPFSALIQKLSIRPPP